MAQIKQTPEYNLAVVPYRPYQTLVSTIVVCLIIVLASLLSYYGGIYRISSIEQSAILERDKLLQFKMDKLEEIAKLEQQVANFSLGTQVDRKATEQIRGQMVVLNNRIAELERDNTFYRDLMSPNSKDQGIFVGAPAVSSVGEGNIYDYKMVVKQLNTNRLQVGGYVEFVIVGLKNGTLQRIPLKDLSSTITNERIKLNFRYFQHIEGKLTLPPDFSPDRIELKVVSIRPKKTVIEKKFSWTIKES